MSTRRVALSLFLTAAALNFGWEMIQMSAYTHQLRISITLLSCWLAALGDAAYTVLLYWWGKALIADERWALNPSLKTALAIMFLGFATALIIERVGIYKGLWQYAGSMPVLPVLKVGLLPVFQLMFLPLIVICQPSTNSTNAMEMRCTVAGLGSANAGDIGSGSCDSHVRDVPCPGLLAERDDEIWHPTSCRSATWSVRSATSTLTFDRQATDVDLFGERCRRRAKKRRWRSASVAEYQQEASSN